ncbi:MAG: hypothetical protein ACOCU6_02025 [Nanoarchaeota archaeon]
MILLPIVGAIAESTMPGAILLATGILALNVMVFTVKNKTLTITNS